MPLHDIPEFDPRKYPDHEFPNPAASVEFFNDLSLARLHVVAIIPRVKPAEDDTFDRLFSWPSNRTDIRAYLEQLALSDNTNVYYCPNEASSNGHKPPKEEHVTRLNAIVVDVDPLATTSEEAWINERKRIKTIVNNAVYSDIKPSYVVNTGNGAQLVYFLVPVENTPDNRSLYIEALKALSQRIGGDVRTTHRVSGLFRVPGTRNAPSQSKRARGSHAVPGGTWLATDKRYDLAELHNMATVGWTPPPEDDTAEYRAHDIEGLTYAMLVDAIGMLDPRIDAIIKDRMLHSDTFTGLCNEMTGAVVSGDRSKADYQFSIELLEAGMSAADVACALAHYSAKGHTRVDWEVYTVRTVIRAKQAMRRPAEDWYDDSGDEEVEQEQGKPTDERTWKTAEEMAARAYNTPTPLIKGLLPRTGPALMFGQSNSGKSLVALEMCSCLAANVPFAGMPVKSSGLCIYLVLEGRGSFSKRVAALREHFKQRDTTRLRFIDEDDYDLFINEDRANPRSLAGLTKKLREISTQAELHIDLVVIDVLNSIAGAADENTAKDMTPVMERIKVLGKRFNCTTLTVHHGGKDLRKGSRGSTVIKTKSDTELEVVAGNRGGSLMARKQRDIDFDKDRGIPFRIASIPIGLNAEGDELTGGLAIMDEISPSTFNQPLNDAERRLIALLHAVRQPQTAKQIADGMDISITTARELIRSLIGKRYLHPDDEKVPSGARGRPVRTYSLYNYDDFTDDDDDDDEEEQTDGPTNNPYA
jgi:hypothetical protein